MATDAEWNRPNGSIAGDDTYDSNIRVLPLLNNGSPSSDHAETQLPPQILLLGMNYKQRFLVFVCLLILSGLFFVLGFTVGLIMLTIRPQKFASYFTMGSLTFMGSFAILRGPDAQWADMLSPADRLRFTIVYLGSMVATLYFTFYGHDVLQQGYFALMVASDFHVLALLWYLSAFHRSNQGRVRRVSQQQPIPTPISDPSTIQIV